MRSETQCSKMQPLYARYLLLQTGCDPDRACEEVTCDVWSCTMPGLSTHSVQELHVGTVHSPALASVILVCFSILFRFFYSTYFPIFFNFVISYACDMVNNHI